MEKIATSVQLRLFLSIMLFALLTRIAIPPVMGHPPNFSAIDAIALFCGAYFNRRFIALVTVLFAVWAGDILLSKTLTGQWSLFYEGFYWQYGCYFLMVFIGRMLKDHLKPTSLLLATLASSVLFFAVSNFGVWWSGSLYPLTFNGLIACYVAAIPFFKNTLFSDLFFSICLFGAFELFGKFYFKPERI